jgi:hypothetical protein
MRHVVASSIPLPKTRPPPADQGRRHAAHHWGGVRLHDQHGEETRGAEPLAAGCQAGPRQRGCADREQGARKDCLLLKRAAFSRPSGQWSDDDFDVLANGEVVGRIYKANAAPVGWPWMWTTYFAQRLKIWSIRLQNCLSKKIACPKKSG